MKGEAAVVEAVGALCAVGIGAPQIAASVRAGVSRVRESSILTGRLEPVRLALLPDDALEPLATTGAPEILAPRSRRMLQLGSKALAQIAPAEGDLAPLLLAVPGPSPTEAGFLPALHGQCAGRFDLEASRLFPRGRAGALLALEAALALLRQGAEAVIVGGVDTFLDLRLLAMLEAEDRLLSEGVMDGFIPGEGAAFLRLTTARAARRSIGDSPTAILALGIAHDPGHRYGTAPHKGEGLSEALERMTAAGPASVVPARTVLASLNGENLGAKEWGVARLRHRALFDDDANLVHPADCFGDTGAAAGALLLALAHQYAINDPTALPMIVWATSDHGDCGAAYIARPR